MKKIDVFLFALLCIYLLTRNFLSNYIPITYLSGALLIFTIIVLVVHKMNSRKKEEN